MYGIRPIPNCCWTWCDAAPTGGVNIHYLEESTRYRPALIRQSLPQAGSFRLLPQRLAILIAPPLPDSPWDASLRWCRQTTPALHARFASP